MTNRIRWEPNGDGNVLMGYAGTRPGVAFRIYAPDHKNCRWLLSIRLIESGKFIYAAGPDDLKAEAERWLEEFVSSLGAVFPVRIRNKELFVPFSDEDDGEPLEVKYAAGKRVRYVHPDYGYPGEQEPAAAILVLGAAYTIARHSIGQSRTDLILEGIPGEWFNSVFFEPADDEAGTVTACHRPGCATPITGTPVTDPEDRAGRLFCCEGCLTGEAEAGYEQRYGPGVAT